ncbi:MAG: hypothetical protein C4582_07940 [Desulfobacteraceae bacterium]|nr:MAG: hypothetical protein C4582_07940 [Desulfobacteraceae bacterium]
MKAVGNDFWKRVSRRLEKWSHHTGLFRYGQQDSLKWISERLPENGIIIADEVGMGKTRIALLTMMAVLEEGGKVVAVVPPGLLYQWRQEAEEVMRALNSISRQQIYTWTPVLLRTFEDLFEVIGERDRYPLANTKENRWVLISQTFDLYRVRSTAHCWRIELPALVRAHRAISEGAHGRDKWIQYRRQRRIEGLNYQEYPWLYMEDKAAKYLSNRTYSQEYLTILHNENIRPNIDGYHVADEICAEFFQLDQPGRKLLMHLVGKLIGPIDLLVMDEAHKSREDGEKPQKRLGRLLNEILIPSKQCRRISMTATPIELGPDQWLDLLLRTGITKKYAEWPKINAAIQEFALLLTQARSRPDQLEVLDRLIESARQFENALAPFVTRRRRMHQEEMLSLLPQNPEGAHPHRNLLPCRIDIQSLTDPWRKMVLALEGQGLAAKGILSLGMAQRQADIRYSSGLQCQFEYDEPSLETTNGLSRKDLRARAWAKLQKGLSDSLSRMGKSWLWDHPRIVQAANRIEELCKINGLNPQEKVLVFGRFSEPMRALRDTLNIRQTLRILDSEKIGLVPYDEKLEQHLYHHYQQQFRQGIFSGNLAGAILSKERLLAILKQARARYEKLRDSLRNHFHGEMTVWIGNQPADAALNRLKAVAKNVFNDLFELLRADLLDHILYQSITPESISEADIHRLTGEIWVSHLRCILHDSDEREESDSSQDKGDSQSTNYQGGDKELADLVSRAGQISPKRFKEYLDREPRSYFCRIMDGSVHHATRRSIQASFNRHDSGPYVLIAQSMVGREGLNLHKACRKVFLFHPEWNPGVMEQQIGRVDRIESLWTHLAEDWKQDREKPYPIIEIESLVFSGTYDEYQANILRSRRAALNAQLFGALLDEETMEKVPEEYRNKLAEAAPDLGPGR